MAYDEYKIAKELTATALGESYFGNALYVARDLPCVTDDDRIVLNRWLDGSSATKDGADGFRLQDIAIRIRIAADAEKVDCVDQYYSDRNASGLAANSR